MKTDNEHQAAVAFLKACSDLLAAQQTVQPGAFQQIREEVGRAAELRFEATVTVGSRSAHLRIVTLDGQGDERMLVRALDLAAPRGGDLQ